MSGGKEKANYLNFALKESNNAPQSEQRWGDQRPLHVTAAHPHLEELRAEETQRGFPLCGVPLSPPSVSHHRDYQGGSAA